MGSKAAGRLRHPALERQCWTVMFGFSPELAGTLAIFAQYGVGNPRLFVSGRAPSLVNW